MSFLEAYSIDIDVDRNAEKQESLYLNIVHQNSEGFQSLRILQTKERNIIRKGI